MNRTQAFSIGAVALFFGATTFALRADRQKRAGEQAARLAHVIVPAPDTFEPSAKPASPMSLTASDGRGLTLASLTAHVVVEEPVAFTEIHLVFDNPADRVIEGTFSISLPPGASVGRFAMKLGETWQEGEVVEKLAARRAYEDFLHRRQDPALLEQGPGNEFTARVFPIPARGRKELIVSYSQEIAGRPYTLPLHGLPPVGSIEVSATSSTGRRLGNALVQKGWEPTADFVLPSSGVAATAVRADNLVVARVNAVPEGRLDPLDGAIVLFDTSASRALGFEEQLALLQRLVKRIGEDAPGAQVSIACFDQTTEPIFTGPASAFGEKEVAAIRARSALGASNLERALAWAGDQARATGRKRLILVGDGVATAGATSPEKLAASVRSLQDRIDRIDAVAVGGIRDEAALRRITTAGLTRDGAVLDGQLSTASLARRLNESTRSRLPVVVDGATWSWPKEVDGVQAGDEIVVYAEVPSDSLTVRIDGVAAPVAIQRVERPIVERAWAKAKIDSLVAAERVSGSKPETQKEIVDLSVRHRVTSPYTSYLVLETEADYARFKIDRNALNDVLAVENGRVILRHRAAPDFGKLAREKSDTPPAPAPSMVDLLNTGAGGGNSGGDADPLSARGNAWGDAVGDAFGAGGLGLSGVGEGGGGRGEGIGLGNIGTLGHGAGTGTGQGFGSGHGRLGGAHSAHPPSVRLLGTEVSGRLPPEVIQRIVRQNYGRFRLCYENSLITHPRLEGRVNVAFVIDRSGALTTVRDDGSAIGDPNLVSCIVSAFRNLSFPQPEGGIVTVRYGIALSPGDGTTRTTPVALDMPGAPAEKPKPVDPYTGKFKEVMGALAKGANAEALATATRWRAEAPGDVMALTALGEVYEKTGDVSRAERAYGSIIDLFASRADLRRYAGARLERIQDPGALELALDSFEKAVAERPDHPQSHRLLAYALLKSGDPARAFDAAAVGARQQYPSGRFAGADRILKEDLGLIAAAWTKQEPKRGAEIAKKLEAAGGTIEDAPSIRFVLNWETDANDVDFHIHDDRGGHAYYANTKLASGGELYADVTTGYGPECFTIRGPRESRAALYTLQANYYSIGPMGYGMGKLEIVDHDGKGTLRFEERPYVVMVNRAFVDLGTVKR